MKKQHFHLLGLLPGLLAMILAPGLPLTSQTQARPGINVILPPGGIIQGQRFELYFELDDRSADQALVFMPNLGNGLQVLSGPETMRSSGVPSIPTPGPQAGPGMIAGTPKPARLYIRYVILPTEAGYQYFPPVSVRVGTRTFLSQETMVPVASARKPAWVPPRLEWSLPSGVVHAGQAVLIRLNLRYLSTLMLPEGLETPQVPGGLLEEVKEAGPIEKETIGGQDFHILPVAAYMLTPSSSGILRIPVTRVTLEGEQVISAPAQISVDPLPDGLSDSGAIGSFTLTSRLDRNQVSVDEQFNLVLELQGSGNMHFLHLPKPVFQDMEILGTQDVTEARAGINGYEGNRTQTYRLASSLPGIKTFTIPAFRFLGAGDVIQEIPSQTVQLRIGSQNQHGENQDRIDLQRLIPSEAVIHTQAAIQSGFWFWFFHVLALGLVVLGVIWRFWRRQRPPRRISLIIAGLYLACAAGGFFLGLFGSTMDPDGIRKAELMDSQARHENWVGALKTGQELLGLWPGQADLMANLSLCAEGLDKPALKIFYLSEALRQEPWREDFRTRLDAAEKEAGLDRQLKIITYPPRLLMALAGSALFLLAGLLVCLFPPKKKEALFYTLGFVFLLAGTVCFGLGSASELQLGIARAVISEQGGSLRKIPDPDAVEWLSLPPGTSLLRDGHTGNFVLAETAFGIQGWIPENRMYGSSSPGIGP